ncbi:MAG TPA: ADOP family duplicated permease [Gemmatimonadaceae bacterium]
MTYGWRRLLRLHFGRTERDVDDEVRFHIAERVAELEALGELPEAARERALEEFGDVDAVRAELVEIDRGAESRRRRADWWEGIVQDARHVARGLLRTPGFAAMVVVTLALGIGANAVVFSLIDRLFFQPPAGVPHPEMVRRIVLHHTNPHTHDPEAIGVYNYPDVRRVAEGAPNGVTISAYVDDELPLGRAPGASRVPVSYVVGNYFGALGLRPEAGRFFDREEQRPAGLTPVVVISHRFWQSRFAGRRDVLGEKVELGAHRYTIIGVAPEHFEGVSLDATELWLPYNTMHEWATRKADWYEVPFTLYLRMIARLPSDGSTNALAAAATNALRQSEIMPSDTTITASLESLYGASDWQFHSGEIAVSSRLGGVALMIFLIACANVANLLLVRALGRRRETAVRLALGVSRRRLAAQFVSEAMLVAAIGGAAALVVTWWGSAILRRTVLPGVRWGDSALTVRVALFAIAATLVAGLVAGMVPAIQGVSPELTAALRGGAREGRSTRGRTRTALLVVQAALAVVLLAGAGLFVRSLRHVEGIDLGYDSERLVFASVAPMREDTVAQRRVNELLPTLADRLAHVGGVERVALASMAPMRGFSFHNVFVPGMDSLPKAGPFGTPIASHITPAWFATVGVSIVRGRGFQESDRAGTQLVAVINETMARTYWPTGGAIGSCMMMEEPGAPCTTIVGIASDAHAINVIEQPAPAYYLPLAQAPDGYRDPGVILLRARAGRVEDVVAAATREMNSMVGSIGTPRVQPMEAMLSRELHQWKLGASLFSVAGLLALLVAGVGIYSTVAYMVGQRTHEIGVRIALGARSSNIARVVLGSGIGIVAAGIAVGLLATLAMGKLVASLLYGVSPRDPVVLGIVALVLLVAAVTACLVPALRAARVDPMETLRAE